ncbi:MAG: hypothetical protein K1X29_03490 [Bdellovibrionales bacterium]|nr:hypothetical protein [Bdellovibrionales bacterium]
MSSINNLIKNQLETYRFKVRWELFFLYALASVFLSACQTESSDLVAPPLKAERTKAILNEVTFDINNKVDMIFEIDDSNSMERHQIRFAEGMDQFATVFAETAQIDFHIGILTNWDNVRYGEYDPNRDMVSFERAVVKSDKHDPLGVLRPLQSSNATALQSQRAKNYITNEADFVSVLRDSLKVGVRTYKKSSTYEDRVSYPASGSEFEDFFSPLYAFLSPYSYTRSGGMKEGSWSKFVASANSDFYRPEAQLMITIVTDGDSNLNSAISSPKLVEILSSLNKPMEDITVIALIIQPGEVVTSGSAEQICKPDYGMDGSKGPKNILDFVSRMRRLGAQTEVLPLCGDYVERLASIGRSVKDRTAREIRIQLGANIPALKKGAVGESLAVFYGDQKVPMVSGSSAGWFYSPRKNEIVVKNLMQVKFPGPVAKGSLLRVGSYERIIDLKKAKIIYN